MELVEIACVWPLLSRGHDGAIEGDSNWVHPLMISRRLLLKGQFTKIYHDPRSHTRKFFNYSRMSSTSFDGLLRRVGLKKTCQPTNMRTSAKPSLLRCDTSDTDGDGCAIGVNEECHEVLAEGPHKRTS
ncbi:hypothetical protein PR048_003767 [Dryococelus australis]|uniref:Uncharacterized protein n=1 Tax=Dryococelus australis TaxID=614101 RepID=A0ABQ9INZ8_9NEOP|nr:hypothetical protein PR048_003767 [Dryococelus australis]